MSTSLEKANEFLKTSHLYRLGDLPTESRHPLTMNLSVDAQNNLNQAIQSLVQVDQEALQKLSLKVDQILELREAIRTTLKNKGRIFMCGCGATGRLSLTLEYLWRELFPASDSVTAFMAGGDTALVHSLEGFEDYPDLGARHLLELGFTSHDLLISSTEGGETPFVIGATEKAAEISKYAPYYLYCNPDDILCAKVERSKRVIENPKIKKINLTVGPMALSGSTRMQASTVLQLAIGYALLSTYTKDEILASLAQMTNLLVENAEVFLRGFIERESQTYKDGDFVLYSVKNLTMTIFTDTTERGPTFSLTAFSHPKAEALLKKLPSPCYIMLADSKTPTDAWQKLLLRTPRALNWIDIDPRTSTEYMTAFDFSPSCILFRKKLVGEKHEHRIFEISKRQTKEAQEIVWSFMDHERVLELPLEMQSFEVHTLTKMLINMHSTLLMGRMGRYKNNVMTWVHPTNGKLVDRATRYILGLLRDEGIERSYEETVRKMFNEMEHLKSNESIVLKTYAASL
jgi:N-acetylmuramic acid 6-phosphate etherase